MFCSLLAIGVSPPVRVGFLLSRVRETSSRGAAYHIIISRIYICLVFQMMNRSQAMAHAFRFLHKSDTDGDYFEFGVYQGQSLIHAYKVHKTNEVRARHFFGFDSFEGLPKFEADDEMEGYDIFHEGQFATSLSDVRDATRKSGADGRLVTFIPGFYDKTLGDPETEAIVGHSKAALVHIDCDLYSSTVPCLKFMESRLVDGAIFMFDDWFCYRGRPDRGVRRAFEEWVPTVPYVFTDYCTYTWSGKMFICNTK